MGYINGFATGFIGAEVGEKSSFKVTFPDNYTESSLAGREVTFEFKVHYIYQFDELTDEMAKDLSDGEFETAEAYEQHQRNLVVQEKLWLTIVENATVKKYPEQHVRFYYQQNRNYYEYYANAYGMSYEELLLAFGLKDSDLWDNAELYVLEDLVYYAIRSEENISLSEEEYNEKIDIYIKRYKDELKYSDAEIKEHMSEIEDNMLYDKVQEMLIAWSDVMWVPISEACAAE
jgi:trigger factor